jgi:lipid-A-disaccharide synthase
VIHYVAPQVWAWRPGRARKLAGVVDHLLALLPFEPPYFTPYGLTCDVVGHPIAAAPRATGAEAATFRAAHGIAPDAPLLAALPGSRMGEVRRHAAPFGAAIAALAARLPGLRVVVPTVAGVADALAARIAGWPGAPVLLDPRGCSAAAADAEKRAAFAAADAALAASGTVTLELAAAGLPMVAAYKTHPLTAAVVRFLLEVDTVVLVNLVAGEKAVPEFLQERFRPEAVADALAPLFCDGPARARQLQAFGRAMAALGAGGDDPGVRAARSVLAALAAPRREGGAAPSGPGRGDAPRPDP